MARSSTPPPAKEPLPLWTKPAGRRLPRIGALRLRFYRRQRDFEYSALGLNASQQDAYEDAALKCAQAGLEAWQLALVAKAFARDGRVRVKL
jgi:hypothetical protein